MAKQPALDEALFPPFEGFSAKGLAFLAKLKKNNNRPWFQKHKEEYEELVRFPMRCLIAELALTMKDEAPEFEFHPMKSIFRIYRDTRFSKNKAPYKTNIAATFEVRGDKSPIETPCFYLGIAPGDIFVGGGLYIPNGAQLKKIRHAIATRSDEYVGIIESKRFKKIFGPIGGEKLQRAPLGYAPDHPMIEHLRNKQFFVGVQFPDGACMKKSFAATAANTMREALPLVRWLIEVS